jgi:hypothetical protein
VSTTADVQRVFLHVGAPKTGTTFLQTVLYDYRDELREHGVLYPARWYDDHFFAAVDLQDLDFSGERRAEADGRWPVVAERVRNWPATSVISHDVFAGASVEHVATAVADLAPAQVHIVFTARDLARQLPSHWQEDVKHGQTASFAEWYAAVLRHDASDWQLRWFWRVEDIPDVLRRWSGDIPSDRVHVVTVPQDGGPSDVLWRRFASVIGLDPDAVDTSVITPPNTGLGVAEIELVRRINDRRDSALSQAEYERAVKGLLAHDTLARRTATRRFGLPKRLFDDVVELSRQWVEQLREAGYDVVGDLADLIPAGPADETADPDSATDAEIVDAAVFALRELVARAHADGKRLGELTGEVDRLRAEVGALEAVVREHRDLPHWERVKRTVVEIGHTSPNVGRALDVYRRARRR